METINTITVGTEDGKEKTIRVFGHPSDPHFCGKDICAIMEIENPKKAMFDNVEEDHKIELKNLLKDLNNGPIIPSWVVTFKGEVEKEREIMRAEVLNEGKPQAVVERIVDGKINKYYSEICLLEQPFV